MAFFFKKKKKTETSQPSEQAKKEGVSVSTALRDTHAGFFSKIVKKFTGSSNSHETLLDELEELLIGADVGVDATVSIIENLQKLIKKQKKITPEEIVSLLKAEITSILSQNKAEIQSEFEAKPHIIMVVGINGVGKTTSIGKLANKYKNQQKSVVLGAADTFRAAAIDQLQLWAERADVRVVFQKMGSDPASVIYDTVVSAKSKEEDVAILDTAGRLHNKSGLMQELARMKKVIKKLDDNAPQEILLVLDATSGQNAVQQCQCQQFSDIIGLTGIIITKLDGTAKGGVIIGIAHKFNIPIQYVCTGEGIADLQDFDAKTFVDGLFAKE